MITLFLSPPAQPRWSLAIIRVLNTVNAPTPFTEIEEIKPVWEVFALELVPPFSAPGKECGCLMPSGDSPVPVAHCLVNHARGLSFCGDGDLSSL